MLCEQTDEQTSLHKHAHARPVPPGRGRAAPAWRAHACVNLLTQQLVHTVYRTGRCNAAH
eukprot:11173744-Lingulodinium_polyedra.AAC.1